VKAADALWISEGIGETLQSYGRRGHILAILSFEMMSFIDQEDPVSELHDDLERARAILEKESITDTDELVAAWEHILCHPDFQKSESDVCLSALANAGTAYLRRYRITKQMKDLERALELWQEAVEQSPVGLPERFLYTNNLGVGFMEHYNHTRNLTDLEQAIQAWELTVQLARWSVSIVWAILAMGYRSVMNTRGA
jgi:tetratricopeptide (TPR) repeat protein